MIFIRIKTETKITNLIRVIELALPVNLYIDRFILYFCHLTDKIYFGFASKFLTIYKCYLYIFLYFEHKKDKPQASATQFFLILIITNKLMLTNYCNLIFVCYNVKLYPCVCL